jgi:hypothetical protein
VIEGNKKWVGRDADTTKRKKKQQNRGIRLISIVKKVGTV